MYLKEVDMLTIQFLSKASNKFKTKRFVVLFFFRIKFFFWKDITKRKKIFFD